jgi:hypothetical protein
MPALVVGIVLDGGGEKGVDKGGFSKSRFASNLIDVRKKYPGKSNCWVHTIMVKAAPLFATIL